MEEALQNSFLALSRRTLREFRRGHVLQFADGQRLSLDFNLTANNDEELKELVAFKCAQVGKGVLPAAPLPMWERFVNAPVESMRHFVYKDLPGARYQKVPVVVRVEV